MAWYISRCIIGGIVCIIVGIIALLVAKRLPSILQIVAFIIGIAGFASGIWFFISIREAKYIHQLTQIFNISLQFIKVL